MLSPCPDATCAARLGVALFLESHTVSSGRLSDWRRRLSAPDRQKLGRLGSTARTRSFITARILLQTLTRHQFGRSAEVRTTSTGKPYLALEDRRIACSISHSLNGILVAYHLDGDVGVDIETHKSRRFDALVDTYFHTDEVNKFKRLGEPEKLPWFYDRWCRKEAVAKLDGQGLSLATVSMDPGQIPDVTIQRLAIENYSAVIAYRSFAQPRVFRLSRRGDNDDFHLGEIPYHEKIAVIA